MALLILGIVLWAAAHFFKRIAPDARARMGDAGRGVVTVLLLASLAAMIFGYRAAPFITVWSPPAFMTHINNLLMVLALYLFASSTARPGKVWIASKVKHPQLAAFKTWAVAHLLVNGDLASVLLFGGLFAWALASVIIINRTDGPGDRSSAPVQSEGRLIVATVIAFSVIAVVHTLLGKWPFA
ncbi:MAG: NnrU family protein [Rhodobacteraceae bacterium]|nr:NnrU family protein [Paracoccaceae bacterium]